MKLDCSLLCPPQEQATIPCPNPEEFSPHSHRIGLLCFFETNLSI